MVYGKRLYTSAGEQVNCLREMGIGDWAFGKEEVQRQETFIRKDADFLLMVMIGT